MCDSVLVKWHLLSYRDVQACWQSGILALLCHCSAGALQSPLYCQLKLELGIPLDFLKNRIRKESVDLSQNEGENQNNRADNRERVVLLFWEMNQSFCALTSNSFPSLFAECILEANSTCLLQIFQKMLRNDISCMVWKRKKIKL